MATVAGRRVTCCSSSGPPVRPGARSTRTPWSGRRWGGASSAAGAGSTPLTGWRIGHPSRRPGPSEFEQRWELAALEHLFAEGPRERAGGTEELVEDEDPPQVPVEGVL